MAYKKMNPKYKAPWVKALRSGDYAQVKEMLYGGLERDPDTSEVIPNARGTFCCLGVLCEITEEITSKTKVGTRSYGLIPSLSNYKTDDELDKLHQSDPDAVIDWYDSWEENLVDGELNNEMMTFFGISAVAQRRLIQMNDDQDKTFDQIADWVEKNL